MDIPDPHKKNLRYVEVIGSGRLAHRYIIRHNFEMTRNSERNDERFTLIILYGTFICILIHYILANYENVNNY
jgi:hypothetical protein